MKTTAKDQASSGAWRVTLASDDELAVTGNAYFPDGKPAAGLLVPFFQEPTAARFSRSRVKPMIPARSSVKLGSGDVFLTPRAILEHDKLGTVLARIRAGRRRPEKSRPAKAA